MKKHIAISVFIIFFLAQFGKVINFCLCTVASYQQTKTLNCDCEKQLIAATGTETKNQIPQSHPALPQFDELFNTNNQPAFLAQYFVVKRLWIINHKESLQHNIRPGVFRPPVFAA